MFRNTVNKLIQSAKGGAHQTYRDWWNAHSETIEQAYASTISPQNEGEYRSRGWNGDANSYGAKHYLKFCGLKRDSKVLEIGCGIARIGRELAPHVGEWHGADISTNMLAHARKRCNGMTNVFFHELDGVGGIRALPYANYDFVYATIVLMHLDKEDLFEYLRQAHRLLKVGGVAYFDTWNITHPDVFRIWREAGVVGDGKPRGRVQCSTPAELGMYLDYAGFEILQMEDTERLARAFCRKPEESVPPVVDDNKPPFGYLCSPANEEVVSGTVNLEGWSIDRIVSVEVFIDGKQVGKADRGFHRDEVPPAFPRYAPEVQSCGFVYELDTTKLSDGHHEVGIVATDLDGKSTPLTGLYQGFTVANSKQ